MYGAANCLATLRSLVPDLEAQIPVVAAKSCMMPAHAMRVLGIKSFSQAAIVCLAWGLPCSRVKRVPEHISA